MPKDPTADEDDTDEENPSNEAGRGYIKLFTKNKNTSRPNQLLMCVTCGNTFTKLCNVMDHIRMHRGLRPFMCKYCNQSFAQKGNRDRHQKKGVCMKDRQTVPTTQNATPQGKEMEYDSNLKETIDIKKIDE